MPAPVIERASEILARLESMASQGATMGPEELGAQMALFDAGRLPAKRKRRPKPAPEAVPREPSEVERELLAAEPEKMTPLEAMQLLGELRRKLQKRD
jgi:DNA mismatch repair ATPase MutS